ncbi:MAG: 2-amino-4-hydroxy-6-hydroxymethyldihydropteridine diphosphokinase [Verrucomicrobiota bacterium]
MPTVIIALGSNLGDSPALLRQAVVRLQPFSRQSLRVSSFWETEPMDCPPGSPTFLNAVALLDTLPEETPETLLEKLLTLEKEFGRRPKQILNEPRPLDLDLIAFGQETRHSPRLTLPHPRAHQRRFVLGPLNEIAPDLVLPGQSDTVAALLASLARPSSP